MDWALPQGIDPDDERRARLLMLFALVVVPSVFVFAGFYLVSGFVLSAAGTLCAFVLIGASPFVMRRTTVAAGTHTFMVGGVLGLVFIVIVQGGLESPATAWFALGPWTATMLGGRRLGLGWAAVTVVVIGTIGSLDLIGSMPPSEVPEPRLHLVALLVHVGLLVLATMMASSHEQERALNFAALVLARDQARLRTRELEAARDRIAADAQAQQRLELELRSAQKLQAVGRLAAGIAHEINTPLQYMSDSLAYADEAIADLIRLARRNTPQSQVSRETLEAELDLPFLLDTLPRAQARAREGLDRIARIVAAMRELARPEGDTFERFALDHLAATALVLADHEIGPVADMTLQFADNLPEVNGRPAAIGQAILALLSNAAHAIADRGPTRGRITVTTRNEGDTIALTVADTGTGIAEPIRDRIFDPYFTTKDVGRGAGQGLALAYQAVVVQHGGTLTFETELGQGTTFTLRLPTRRPLSHPNLPHPDD